MKILKLFNYSPGEEFLTEEDAKRFKGGEFTHALVDTTLCRVHVYDNGVSEFDEVIGQIWTSTTDKVLDPHESLVYKSLIERIAKLENGNKDLPRLLRQNDQLAQLRSEDRSRINGLEVENRAMASLLQSSPFYIKPDDENVYSDGDDSDTYFWCQKVQEFLKATQTTRPPMTLQQSKANGEVKDE